MGAAASGGMLSVIVRLVWILPSLYTAAGACAVLYTAVKVDATPSAAVILRLVYVLPFTLLIE